MAGDADHEGLPAQGGHEMRPRGLWPSRLDEVSEFADLVDFHLGASSMALRATPECDLPRQDLGTYRKDGSK